jgi:hypothetical protein
MPRRAQALLSVAQVLGRVIAGRPVLPEPVEERHVACGDHRLCAGGLHKEEVEEASQLVVVAEDPGVDRGGRHRDRHQLAPAFRRERRRAVAGLCSPIISDQDCLVITTESIVEGDRVGNESAQLVATVDGKGCRRISAHERCHPTKARSRQLRQQVPPAVRRVRKSVQAQGQRPAARLENPELDPIRRDAPAAHVPCTVIGR